MFSILCPICGKKTSFNTENGDINCECGTTINVTELNLPEYGPYKRSKYINELAVNNSLPQTTDSYSESTSYKFPEIVGSLFSASDISCIVRQWAGCSIFTTGAFNKAIKKMDMTLSYVPLYVYEVKSSIILNAIATANDDSVDSDRKIIRTHYYNIEHLDNYSDTHVRSASETISNEVLPELLPYDFSDTSIYDENDTNEAIINITADKDLIFKNLLTDISEHMKKNIISSADDYSSIYNCETEEFPFSTNIRTVYVPLWKMNYHHKGHIKTVYINGQTGKIYGSSPLSFIKTIGLVALSGLFIFAIIAAFIL
ncbi:MAG: hypothetical protein E7267_02165 [Lachnospiraceae bacterium]|nr:hypothetical protein [Lachnospiraceae bacterium]